MRKLEMAEQFGTMSETELVNFLKFISPKLEGLYINYYELTSLLECDRASLIRHIWRVAEDNTSHAPLRMGATVHHSHDGMSAAWKRDRSHNLNAESWLKHRFRDFRKVCEYDWVISCQKYEFDDPWAINIGPIPAGRDVNACGKAMAMILNVKFEPRVAELGRFKTLKDAKKYAREKYPKSEVYISETWDCEIG